MTWYVLRDKEPVLVGASEQSSAGQSAVGRTKRDGIMVSTVFLGLDHQYGDGPPLLFETMIFGGIHDEFCERCSTWAQAEEQHALAVKIVWPEDKGIVDEVPT